MVLLVAFALVGLYLILTIQIHTPRCSALLQLFDSLRLQRCLHLAHFQCYLDFLRELVIRLLGLVLRITLLTLRLLVILVYAVRLTQALLMDPDHAAGLCKLEEVAIFEWSVGPWFDGPFVDEGPVCRSQIIDCKLLACMAELEHSMLAGKAGVLKE